MNRSHCLLTSCALGLLCLSIGFAQKYRCDWSVTGLGGGEMSSSAYKCNATAGQTAAGLLTSPNYWALVGFWLPEGQEGVEEESKWSSGQVVETKLYSPFPTPFARSVFIRYSLAAAGRVELRVHDLTGRAVRTLANGAMRPGRYSLSWSGTDDRGRVLANGVYFCRFAAGDYRATQKLVVQR